MFSDTYVLFLSAEFLKRVKKGMKKSKKNIYMAMRRPCLAASAFGIYEVLRLPHSEIYMLDKINGLVLPLSFFPLPFYFCFFSPLSMANVKLRAC